MAWLLSERHEGDTYRVAGSNAELTSKKKERMNEEREK